MRWPRPVLLALVYLAGCAAAGETPTRTAWREIYRQRDRTSTTSTAESESPGELRTLDQILEHAESSNPGLRATFHRWTAALEQVPQAKSLPDPRVSYAWFLEPVETRVGPQRQKLGVTQTIPLFGKRGLKGEMALHAANAQGARFEHDRLELRFRLSRLWNDYYYLNRATAVTEENLRLVAHLEGVALARYSAGRASHSAVIRAQVELGRLEDRLRTLRDQRRPLLASLNAELNRPTSAPIAWPDSLDYRPIEQSEQELAQILLEENPQLEAMRLVVERDDAAARLAGKGAIPDLTIGAEYIDTDDASDRNVTDSGKDSATAMATINIPLWFGRYRAEKSQARARRSATERELAQLENRLLAELAREYFELMDADRRVELYAHTLLPKAQQSLAVTEEAFTAGSTTFLDLIDAQQTLLEFELAYERALADRATSRARLEQLVGREVATRGNRRTAP